MWHFADMANGFRYGISRLVNYYVQYLMNECLVGDNGGLEMFYPV
jgi:hypothetical protein